VEYSEYGVAGINVNAFTRSLYDYKYNPYIRWSENTSSTTVLTPDRRSSASSTSTEYRVLVPGNRENKSSSSRTL
jgi:hypothetical protein